MTKAKYMLSTIDDNIIKYQCGGCNKIYKTEAGCRAHLEKCESFPELDDTPFMPIATDLDKRVEELATSLGIQEQDIGKLKEDMQNLSKLVNSVEEIIRQLKALNLWRD